MSDGKRTDETFLLAIVWLLLLHVLQPTHYLSYLYEQSIRPTAVWAYVAPHLHKVSASYQLVGASFIQLRPFRVTYMEWKVQGVVEHQ